MAKIPKQSIFFVYYLKLLNIITNNFQFGCTGCRAVAGDNNTGFASGVLAASWGLLRLLTWRAWGVRGADAPAAGPGVSSDGFYLEFIIYYLFHCLLAIIVLF